jgi:hypothetical protein
MESLTDLELAAICYHVETGCKNNFVLFKIAEGEIRYNKLSEKSLKTTVSNWFKSHKIQEGIKQYKLIQEQRQKEIIDKYISSLDPETEKPQKKTTNPEDVNFLNLDEFLRYANEQANNIKDEKEKRAWVEMIGKYMNFKESETDETEQIKAYLPVNCQDCELYKRCKGCKFDICPV